MNDSSKTSDSRTPVTVKITLLLVFLNVVIWAGFAFFVAIGGHPSYLQLGWMRWAMAVLSLITAAVLFLFGYFLWKRYKLACSLAIALLAGIVVIIFFDDIGWVDLIVMLGTAIPLIFLIKDRAWYHKRLPRKTNIIQENNHDH
jgi:hypothetical protein